DALEDGDANVVSFPRVIAGETSRDVSSTLLVTEQSWVRSRPRLSGTWLRGWQKLAMAVSLAILTVAAGTLLLFEFSAPTYATALGEHRSLELADGSTVELNSHSRIRVRYSKQERDVEIVEGQALFRVAHDTSRPFIVAV